MKFSYSLLKKFAPGIPTINKFADELALKSFEVEETVGDMIDIKITANRWSDAASHRGIAREAAAIYGLKEIFPAVRDLAKRSYGALKVEIKDVSCSRYIGILMDIKKVGSSPSWMQKTLEVCGMRPINGVVDALNYIMLETGQPMHAFDADKVKGGIIVRKAKKGEKITTIDNREIELSVGDTVIADAEKALAIAGIKGGKAAEITDKTKRIIIESACFTAGGIYRTARNIKLQTDASQRYGHGMSPSTAAIGAGRAILLMEDICGGEVRSECDIYPKKQGKTVLKFDIERFSKITGVKIPKDKAFMMLRRLGFKVSPAGLVEVPPERLDVTIFEDLVEEVIRIYGLDAIQAVAPVVSLVPVHSDESYAYKERVKNAIATLGYDEIYSYSFGGDPTSGIELMNPMNQEKRFMRASIIPGLERIIDDSSKKFDKIGIFEIGKVFDSLGKEHWSLAFAVHHKKDDQVFRDLKGAVLETMRKGGVVDVSFAPGNGRQLMIEIEGKKAGIFEVSEEGRTAYAEANLEMMMASASQEFEYKPISPYPSIMRDISVWIPEGVSVGDMMQGMERSGAVNLEDTDIIDYFKDADRTAATFRLVFQSYKETLSDSQADTEMKKIISVLEAIPGVKIR